MNANSQVVDLLYGETINAEMGIIAILIQLLEMGWNFPLSFLLIKLTQATLDLAYNVFSLNLMEMRLNLREEHIIMSWDATN